MKLKDLRSNYTTVKQSKQLLELGIPADSADMWYIGSVDARTKYPPFPSFSYWVDGRVYKRDLPCWSVGRLIEIYCLATGVEYTKIGVSEISLTELMVKMIEISVKVKTFDFSKLELN